MACHTPAGFQLVSPRQTCNRALLSTRPTPADYDRAWDALDTPAYDGLVYDWNEGRSSRLRAVLDKLAQGFANDRVRKAMAQREEVKRQRAALSGAPYYGRYGTRWGQPVSDMLGVDTDWDLEADASDGSALYHTECARWAHIQGV
jgi:hypothetical protein